MTGKDLGTHLGYRENEELKRFYVKKSDVEIREKIVRMLNSKLRDERFRHLKSLLMKLLVVDGEERLNSEEVMNHAMMTREKGTTTRGMVSRMERMLDHQSQTPKMMKEIENHSNKIQDRLDEQLSHLSTIEEQNEEQSSRITDIKEQNEDIKEQNEEMEERMVGLVDDKEEEERKGELLKKEEEGWRENEKISKELNEILDKLDEAKNNELLRNDQEERYQELVLKMARSTLDISLLDHFSTIHYS
jgi:serine/threonine protein kinase